MPSPPFTLISGGLSVAIGVDGVDAITLNGNSLLCSPIPGAPTAQGFYRPSIYTDPFELPPSSPGTAVLSASGVTVNGACGLLKTSATYSLSGSDLRIAVTAMNGYASALAGLSFALPSFDLGTLGMSNMPSWNYEALGLDLPICCHPSPSVPVALAWLRGTNYGVGIHLPNRLETPTCINAYNVNVGLIGNQQSVQIHIPDSIPAGGTLGFTVVIHFSPTIDLPSIASSYVRDFTEKYPMKYVNSDDRGWIQFSAIDPSWQTPDNPFGYGGPQYRFDTPAGIAAYQAMIAPLSGIAQGVLFWQPQGIRPLAPGTFQPDALAAEYSPSIDVWPPAVTTNFPALLSWLAANGMKSGLAARPTCIETPEPLGGTTVVSYSADDPPQFANTLGRIANVTALGANAFYLDSCGAWPNDVGIVRAIRKATGESIPLFCEWPSDLSMQIAGAYTEPDVALDGGTQYSAETMQIFRLLYPRSNVLMKCDGKTIPTPAQLIAWRYSPLTWDSSAINDVAYHQQVNAALVNNLWPD